MATYSARLNFYPHLRGREASRPRLRDCVLAVRVFDTWPEMKKGPARNLKCGLKEWQGWRN